MFWKYSEEEEEHFLDDDTMTTTLTGRRKACIIVFVPLFIVLFVFSVVARSRGNAFVVVVGDDDDDDDDTSTIPSSVTREEEEEEEEEEVYSRKEENEMLTVATTTEKRSRAAPDFENEQEDEEQGQERSATRRATSSEKRPDERENVPGKYDPEMAPKPPFKVPPVYIPKHIAEALEETGRGPTRPCKCVYGKNEAVYYLGSSEGVSIGSNSSNEEIEEEGDSDSGSDSNDVTTTPESSKKSKRKNAKITFAIFHIANNENHELSQAQVEGITMVLMSAINKHDKCRLVILTDMFTDFTPLMKNFPADVLEVLRHDFAQYTKEWTSYFRAMAEKQFIFDEIEHKAQHTRDNIVFMDSTDIIFAKSIKNVFRDEETKVPHTFGAAWTYRDGSSGANKKWPINFGVRFVNAERIAEAALLSAYFLHALEFFFYTEKPVKRADSSPFFWEQELANWIARRFKRFKDRKFNDRGKHVDASAPIRYVVENLKNKEKGYRCRHVSMRFLPCFLYNGNPPHTFPVKPFDDSRKNIGCRATSKTAVVHMKGSLKRKMKDVFDYYGKPEINDKDGTAPRARPLKINNINNNNGSVQTFINYFGVMKDEDFKSRSNFCERIVKSSS